MRIKGYIAFGVILIFLVVFLYWNHFADNLQYKVSSDPAVWGQFGDYVGGVLNPLLSFISISLLIHSLKLQAEANQGLRNELLNSERTEKIRSFEVLFFNLLDAQKTLFSSFGVEIQGAEAENVRLERARAVIEIESQIQSIRNEGGGNEKISEYVSRLDEDDQIFGVVRAFYVVVAAVTEKLSDEQGFSKLDRVSYFKILINFTDFSQLRLILIAVQFLDFHSTRYIRECAEFAEQLHALDMSFDLY